MSLSVPQQIALAIIPKIAGFTSVLFSGLICFTVLRDEAKRKSPYHRLVCGISVVDMSSSFWLALSTWPIPADASVIYAVGTDATCRLQGFWTQAGIASSFYNVSLSLYYVLVIRLGWKEAALRRVEPWLHIVPIAWGLGTASFALGRDILGNATLWCWIVPTATEWRWALFYGPLWSMIVFVTLNCLAVWLHVLQVERRTLKFTMHHSHSHGNSNNNPRMSYWMQPQQNQQQQRPSHQEEQDFQSINQQFSHLEPHEEGEDESESAHPTEAHNISTSRTVVDTQSQPLATITDSVANDDSDNDDKSHIEQATSSDQAEDDQRITSRSSHTAQHEMNARQEQNNQNANDSNPNNNDSNQRRSSGGMFGSSGRGLFRSGRPASAVSHQSRRPPSTTTTPASARRIPDVLSSRGAEFSTSSNSQSQQQPQASSNSQSDTASNTNTINPLSRSSITRTEDSNDGQQGTQQQDGVENKKPTLTNEETNADNEPPSSPTNHRTRSASLRKSIEFNMPRASRASSVSSFSASFSSFGRTSESEISSQENNNDPTPPSSSSSWLSRPTTTTASGEGRWNYSNNKNTATTKEAGRMSSVFSNFVKRYSQQARQKARLKRTKQVAKLCFRYAVAFYINWTALTVIRIIQIFDPTFVSFGLFLVAGFTTPIQGLPNFLIYLGPIIYEETSRQWNRAQRQRMEQRLGAESKNGGSFSRVLDFSSALVFGVREALMRSGRSHKSANEAFNSADRSSSIKIDWDNPSTVQMMKASAEEAGIDWNDRKTRSRIRESIEESIAADPATAQDAWDHEHTAAQEAIDDL